MDGWWWCNELDEFFNKILRAELHKQIQPWRMAIPYVKSLVVNHQTRLKSTKVAKEHYDLSKELYDSFLDPYNQYTCGYWKDTNNLDDAQEAKLHLICRKLGIQSGDNVLDVGCGWGGFAKFASKHYDCNVTGITISEKQLIYAQKFVEGLPPVQIKLMDYRDLGHMRFDKVVVVGMIEHVGYKNYQTLMKKVYESLKPGGLFLLHTIGGLESVTNTDPWIEKYIFPNSMLPSVKQLAKAAEGLFVLEDFHNFGPDYDKTLMAWYENFESNWGADIPEYHQRGIHFGRMWKYYLLSCAGSFRSRQNQLWQIVFSKNPVGIYTPVR